MFLVDDLFLAPGKFVFWIVRQVHEAAEQEMDQEADRITAELAELHRLLESGRITEAAFDAREGKLLDRLDSLKERGPRNGARDADDDA